MASSASGRDASDDQDRFDREAVEWVAENHDGFAGAVAEMLLQSEGSNS